MRNLKTRAEITSFLELLRKRSAGNDLAVEKRVVKILSEVRTKGDVAVRAYTRALDRHTLPIRITPDEMNRHAGAADRAVVRALEVSARRIRAFHKMQRERSWSFSGRGELLGQIIRPLRRVGVYVPGGKASYPSTVLMNVIPAQIAGVSEIALCVPTPAGETNPNVMAAVVLTGVSEVYRIGGAQAVGAMAYGTKSVPRVDKIVGPGNIYVALAKRRVFGEVDIDMIAGPSEILIIADDTALPEFIAADMLSQAEHDELASSILITTSPALATEVQKEITRQMSNLLRKEIAAKSLKRFGAVITVPTVEEAVSWANAVAPEHLEIITRNATMLAKRVENAGAVFLGPWTPEPLGDYSAGPNHTLPTGGTARFSSPLGVYDFLKRMSILRFDWKGFAALADTVQILAESEGLQAHANTVRVRKRLLKHRMPNA